MNDPISDMTARERTASEQTGKSQGRLRRIWKYLLLPLAVVLAMLCVFMLVINTSSRAAAACGKIPVLRELTEALRFSRSRFVTVDNEACQPVQQLLTWEDVAVRVDFLVIDENRMTVFYQVESDRETPLSVLASLESAGGQGESEWIACNEYSEGPLKGLSSVTGSFPEGVPADLRLRVDVSASEEGDQAAFRHVFLCYPDYSVREPAVRHYDLDRTLDLWTDDGRTSRIRVTGLDVSADHVRFTLEALPDNPYWFEYLRAFVETPYRNRYDPSDFAAVKYDMVYDAEQTYMGRPYFFFHEGTEEEQAVLQVDGVLFNGASSLTLGIAGMAFESKAAHVTAHLDLANGTSDSMPEGTELVRILPLEDGWRITLLTDNSQYFFRGYDAKGRPMVRLNWDYARTDPDDPAGEAAPEGWSYMYIDLKDYPYDEIWLDEGSGMEVYLDQPVLETFNTKIP